ncbi:glycerophosphodiester phosphodiesterase family protein [Planococcus sp. N028]|uniref:Glycerophosphodiester phosphodiesterase family protein n=1 Tax=Planococcus shixiaomingii TaxID=3058393 RepID=A0ABT8N1G9_9BACL|nr:glycerophosphodiester phosphodiesterase family protein [Planococcus sp. N028]MDN7241741.1 glycerophosphodiester phosphodiesterase family protein [Planococcus sp. N028]
MSFVTDVNKEKRRKQKPYDWTEYALIAHAAGQIDGEVYTNSLEAFETSYKNGHRLFEIDLSITADGKLVARHGWDALHGQNFNKEEGPLTYKEFMEVPYYGKYTPMDFDALLELLEKYKDIHIVLDGKVSSVKDTEVVYGKVRKALDKSNQKIVGRLIPQMFYKEDLAVIRGLGFQDVIYVVGREEYSPESTAKFCAEHGIGVVSLSGKRTNAEFVQELTHHNIEVYMYTFNEIEKMKPYIKMGVKGFFTDTVLPHDMKDT